MKIFFNRFAGHNFEINIFMMFKFRSDRDKLLFRIMNLKKKTKKTEKNLLRVNRRVGILKIEIFKIRNPSDPFQNLVSIKDYDFLILLVHFFFITQLSSFSTFSNIIIERFIAVFVFDILNSFFENFLNVSKINVVFENQFMKPSEFFDRLKSEHDKNILE